MYKKVSALLFGCCVAWHASALQVSSNDSREISPGANTPVCFRVTNTSGQKVQLTVDIINKVSQENENDNFGIIGNNTYIRPGETEIIKITPYLLNANEFNNQYEVRFSTPNGQMQTQSIRTADRPAKPVLNAIHMDNNGLMKAVVSR